MSVRGVLWDECRVGSVGWRRGRGPGEGGREGEVGLGMRLGGGLSDVCGREGEGERECVVREKEGEREGERMRERERERERVRERREREGGWREIHCI